MVARLPPVTFVFGGLTGVILARRRLIGSTDDSYFVVAHFHYVLFGTVVFAMFAGFYFWWPKWTGKMLDETLGKIHFWVLFIGFHMTFLVQHWLGADGMPRRYADYLHRRFAFLNQVSTVGSLILGLSKMIRSSGTCGSRRARPPRSRSTTRGATADRSSGRRPARRRVTTSHRFRASAPSALRFEANHPELLELAAAGHGPLRPRRSPSEDRRMDLRSGYLLLRARRDRLRLPDRLHGVGGLAGTSSPSWWAVWPS